MFEAITNYFKNERSKNIKAAEELSDKRTFVEDVENDKKKMEAMLSRPKSASMEDQKLEQERADVLKRLALVIGSGDTKLSAGKHSLDAKDNPLPIASYMAGHAGRVMIEIPPAQAGKEHEMFNWLTCGNKDAGSHRNNKVSTKFSGAGALGESKLFFNRRAATHAVDVKANGALKEKKTNAFYEFFNDVIPSFIPGMSERKHWGMNIAPGKVGEKDAQGQDIKADGAHGHLYVYYQPPAKDKPGAILVGLEGTEPGVQGELGDHSLVGAPDRLSPFGGKKWDKSSVLGAEAAEKVAIYDKYSGLTVDLRDPAKLSALYDTKTAEIPDNIGSMLPQKDMKSLKDAIQNREVHTQDTIKSSQTLEARGVLKDKQVEVKKPGFMAKIKNLFKSTGNANLEVSVAVSQSVPPIQQDNTKPQLSTEIKEVSTKAQDIRKTLQSFSARMGSRGNTPIVMSKLTAKSAGRGSV